jgi:hypothetical protein
VVAGHDDSLPYRGSLARTDETQQPMMAWIDGWQMECCGEPFAVGEARTWWLTSQFDRDWLPKVLGDSLASHVTHWEETHAGGECTPTPTEATAAEIRAVYCRYEQRRPNAFEPVPGSALVEPREAATGEEPRRPGLRFVGYIVTLDPTSPSARNGCDKAGVPDEQQPFLADE